MTSRPHRACAPLLLLALLGASPVLQAQSNGQEARSPNVRTERAPVMRQQVFQRLGQARESADAGNYPEAIERAKNLLKDRSLSGYEKAMAWNLVAYAEYELDRIPNAIKAYQEVLAAEDIPQSLEANTRYGLAQMYLTQEQWQPAINELNRWFKMTEKPQPSAYMLLGQAYFQLKDYKRAKEPILTAINDARSRGETIRENWLLLLRAIYFSDKDYRSLLGVLQELAARYPTKEYWLQLSATYSELQQPKRQLAAMWAAYDQGLLSEEREYVTLAQLLLANEVPYRAGLVLDQGLATERIERSARNLRMTADAWVLAKEYDRAIDAFKRAVAVSGDGDTDLRLAQIYLERERWQEAVASGQQALQKGGLKNPDMAHVVIGLAQYELGRLSDSLKAFERAESYDRSRQMAQQWARYVEGEIERRRILEQARAG